MAANLFDDAVRQVNEQKLNHRMLCNGTCYSNECSEHISIQDFLAAACRPLDGLKSIAILFDVHYGIPECGHAFALGDIVAQAKLNELPPQLRFRRDVPSDASVDLIVCNLGDGCLGVMKVVYFKQPVSRQAAQDLCGGKGFAPLFRPGPWAVKKAVQWLLNQVNGFHVRWHVLEPPKEPLKRSQTKDTWNPDNDDLEEGIEFINKNAPECDSRNQQTLWIMKSIKGDSGTAIAGWPEAKVRFMAQNKSRGLGGAQPMTDFPLTTFSLHPAMYTHVLPYVYPLLTTTAVMMLGNPGVGKTPALLSMAMAMGRYHIRRLGLSGVKPGWRRAKSLDNFRHRVPQVYEAIFLDDPTRSKVDIADLKSFVTVDEDGTVESRYNDTRLARNQMRAVASNDTAKDPAIDSPGDSRIHSEKFFALIDTFFKDDHAKDVMAIMKRATFFVFTETAVFLRMPSEKRGATVHRIVADDLHRDLLKPRDKHLLGQYKVGHFIQGEFFADDVDPEQAMIDSAMADFQTFHIKDDYINHVNLQLQMWLTPKPKVRILPPSPESQDTPPDAKPSRSRFGLPPVFPAIGTAPKRGRIGTFNYDNKHRRIRGKTNIDAENYITGAQRDEGTNLDNGETQDAFTPEVAHQNAASSSTIPPSPSGDAMDIAEDAADEAEAKNMFD